MGLKFEEEEIEGMMINIRQFKGEIEVPMALDEVVTLTVTARVTNVSHEVNQRNHRLYRTHVLHVQDVSVK